VSKHVDDVPFRLFACFVEGKRPTSQVPTSRSKKPPKPPPIGLCRTKYCRFSVRALSWLQLVSQISQNWWRLPLFYDELNATGGGPPWASGEAPSRGVRPFAVAQGASQPTFLARWSGHVVHKRPKSYLRLVFHQFGVGHVCACTPVPKNKKTEKMAKQSFPLKIRPLGPECCKAHISKLVCEIAVFLLS
jgi:hypothetical protein